MNDDDLDDLIGRSRNAPADVSDLLKVRRAYLTVPILKRLANESFYRVRGGPEWHFGRNKVMLLQPSKDSGRTDFHLLSDAMVKFAEGKEKIEKSMRWFGLAFVIDADGDPAFWALNLQDTQTTWGSSARDCAERLINKWGMLVTRNGYYDLLEPDDDLGEPSWPEGDPKEWLRRALKPRLIESEDHPVIRKLLGKKI